MPIARLTRAVRRELDPGTLRGQLVRSSGIMGLLKIASGLLVFGVNLMLARVLGPHGFGLFSYVMAWAALLAIVVQMGIPQYLVREGVKAREPLGAMQRWADWRILASGMAAAAAMACAFFIPQAAGARWLFVLAAFLPLLLAAGSIRSALLQSMGEVARSQWPRMLLAPVATLAACAVPWLARGELRASDVMIATLAATALTVAVNSWQLRKRGVAPVQAATALSLRRALPFMWVAGLFLLNSRVDLIMLGTLRGAREAGVYAVAARVAELTAFIMATTNLVLSPRIASLHHGGDKALLRRMVGKATQRVMLWSTPIFLLLVLGASQVLVLVYGAQYADGAFALRMLALAQMVGVSTGPLGTLLNMTGGERALARIMVAALGINVVLNLILIPGFGGAGAACATAASLVLSRLLLLRQVRKHFAE